MKEVKVPILPESINEATVAAWHKKPGDYVEIDDVIVEIETDKVVLEVPAEESGVLTEILAKEGETVSEQQVLGRLDDEAETSSKIPSPEEDVIEEAPKENLQEIPKEPSDEANNESAEEPQITPAKSQSIANDNILGQKESPAMSNRMEERVPMNRIRKTIAKRLHSATQNTAMLTTFNEVDMSAVIDARAEFQEKFEKIHGVRLGFMSYFVKAAIVALKEFPAVNAEIQGDEIVYKNYYNIGVAVGTPTGLVVPVLKNADQMSFADIEKNIKDFGRRARDGQLSLDEMTDGSFTITNGGIYGSMLSTPIINAPQSGILGMHNIVKRPWVVGEDIKVRPIMYLAHSYDHRIVDGREAVSMLVRIKECIENPQRIMLDM